MKNEELKNKIILSIKKIDNEITLLEVLRLLTSNRADGSSLGEPETSYGQINSLKNDPIVSDSFYKILDKEREEMIKHPELAVEWSKAEDLIFGD
jgi:hypothetical protein